MKVILVSALPPPSSGIATWTNMYRAHCEDFGIELTIVNTALRGKRTDTFTTRFSPKDEIVRTLNIVRAFWHACAQAPEAIIHINSSCSPLGIMRDYVCMLIARKKRKTILHCHCNVEDQLRKSRFGHIVMGWAAKRATHVFVLNERSRHYVEKRWPCNIEIIPNFIREDVVLSNEHIIRERIQRVCFTGHVLREKGIDEIILAAKKAPNVQFDIYGIVSEKYRTIQLPGNVHMHGPVEHAEVLKALDETDVFLFPSYSEGFSMSLLEAMARGVPAIATDVGANRDMLESEGGMIIPCQDSAAIVIAMQQMNDGKVRQKMAKWNIEKVKDKYLVCQVMEKLKYMYEHV